MRQFIALEVVVEVAVRKFETSQRRQKQMKSDTVQVKNQPRKRKEQMINHMSESTKRREKKVVKVTK